MGMSAHWVGVAHVIGFDAFLALWRYLDSREALVHDSGQLKIWLRRFSAYQRFQRNRYIETLARAGYSARQIRRLLEDRLCESMTERNVQLILGKRRLRAEVAGRPDGA